MHKPIAFVLGAPRSGTTLLRARDGFGQRLTGDVVHSARRRHHRQSLQPAGGVLDQGCQVGHFQAGHMPEDEGRIEAADIAASSKVKPAFEV